MTRTAKFTLVDVFTAHPFGGNQLTVFSNAAEISSDEMQVIARELNFSESTFVTVSDAGTHRVRIFTPKREIPMAGHPTVGTAWVLATRGHIALSAAQTDATLHLGVGPVTVSISGKNGKPEFVWMEHRAAIFGAIRSDRENIASALGITAAELRDEIPIQIVSTGFPFLFVPIKSIASLARCASNGAALGDLFKPGEERLPVYMFAINDSGDFGVRARMFAPHTDGIVEDPATGSAAGPLGAYVARYHLVPERPRVRFVVDQGIEMQRPSQIQVEVERTAGDALKLRIGGQCAIVGEGEMMLD